MDPTELMYEAAERWYQTHGERHGYSGLVAGVAAVLRETGFKTDGRELADLYHDPLSDFHSSFTSERREVTFEQIAKAMDVPRGFHGRGGEVELPSPFDRIQRHSFPYPLEHVPSAKFDVSWMEKQVDDHLKKEKMKRGSARYKAWVAENAPKVLKAAVESAEKAKKQATEKLPKLFEELNKLHEKALESRAWSARRAEIRRAVLDAAGMPGNAAYNDRVEKTLAAWDAVTKTIEEHAAYLESQVNDIDVEASARHALESHEKLRPFLNG